MVKASAHTVIGLAQLKLVNEASDRVAVKRIVIGPSGEGPRLQALAQEIALAPAQAKTVDVTATVMKVLGTNGRGNIEVQLQINPEEPDQPAGFSYFCHTANGRVVEFH